MDRNRVIGKDNSLPWKLPADMKRFKELTKGKPVIMGRATFESIGNPLPNRTNIVLTREKNFKAEGCVVVHSVDDALKAAKGNEEIMVIGGANVYSQFIKISDRMYLTLIDEDFEGDAYFPEYDESEWKETFREEHEESNLRFAFVDLERIA